MTAVIMIMGEFANMLNNPFNSPAVVQGLHVLMKPCDYNGYHVSRWLVGKAKGRQIRQQEDLHC